MKRKGTATPFQIPQRNKKANRKKPTKEGKNKFNLFAGKQNIIEINPFMLLIAFNLLHYTHTTYIRMRNRGRRKKKERKKTCHGTIEFQSLTIILRKKEMYNFSSYKKPRNMFVTCIQSLPAADSNLMKLLLKNVVNIRRI